MLSSSTLETIFVYANKKKARCFTSHFEGGIERVENLRKLCVLLERVCMCLHYLPFYSGASIPLTPTQFCALFIFLRHWPISLILFAPLLPGRYKQENFWAIWRIIALNVIFLFLSISLSPSLYDSSICGDVYLIANWVLKNQIQFKFMGFFKPPLSMYYR